MHGLPNVVTAVLAMSAMGATINTMTLGGMAIAIGANVAMFSAFHQALIRPLPYAEPEHLVLGVIDYAFPSMSAYVSFDGGERWEGPNQVPYLLKDLGAGGDPVMARSHGILIVEIGVGMAVMAAMISLYYILSSGGEFDEGL